jgi:hypothetical protein
VLATGREAPEPRRHRRARRSVLIALVCITPIGGLQALRVRHRCSWSPASASASARR